MAMAASTAFLSFCSVEPQRRHLLSISQNSHLGTHQASIFAHKWTPRLIYTLSFTNFNPIIPHSNSDSSSSSYQSSSLSTQQQNSLQNGRFLTNDELEKLQFLEDYRYFQELKSGFLYIRMMQQVELDMAVDLLAQSFAESMSLSSSFVRLLEFLVKQYLIERRGLMPHAATLLGFYKEDEEEDLQLAGTVEVSFNKRGTNASPPSPTPPKNAPYICNMAVKEPLRRRGIGWHLLKASEELISQMTSSREVYLHCRMIDIAPLSMYRKAGYDIVKTDSILVLLTLQKRKHLMRKRIPESNSLSEMDMDSEELLS